ncbi:hypothetical protein DFS34DRAFT_596903 [Phlyctochytrium arcticum]|nr:hypothetical protein DFS34DRAFT_596903 [Phlyctochytrium arcticum]
MDDQITQQDYKAVIRELPLELIFKILDYFPEDQECLNGDLYEYPISHFRQFMLAKMSRVCRVWREAMIPTLYRAPPNYIWISDLEINRMLDSLQGIPRNGNRLESYNMPPLRW